MDREGVVPPSRLLRRELELQRLAALVDAVHETGSSLVIRGEAGIGKSALLAEAATRARRQGLTVFQSTAVESETRLPFAGLHASIRPFLGALDRLPPAQRVALEMDGARPDPSRRGADERVKRLLPAPWLLVDRDRLKHVARR